MKHRLTVEVRIELDKLDQDEILDLATQIKDEVLKIEDSTTHKVDIFSYYTSNEGLNCKV